MAFHIMRRNLDLATQPEPPRGMNDRPIMFRCPFAIMGNRLDIQASVDLDGLMQFHARDFEVAVMKEAAN
jgi:hypothetical protein